MSCLPLCLIVYSMRQLNPWGQPHVGTSPTECFQIMVCRQLWVLQNEGKMCGIFLRTTLPVALSNSKGNSETPKSKTKIILKHLEDKVEKQKPFCAGQNTSEILQTRLWHTIYSTVPFCVFWASLFSFVSIWKPCCCTKCTNGLCWYIRYLTHSLVVILEATCGKLMCRIGKCHQV